jgi:hypothetical protein
LNCPGGLVSHLDGTVAACTMDDEPEGCAGRDARHQGEPTTCIAEWGRCDYCGVVIDLH